MALRTVGVFDSVREVEMVREDLLQAGIAPNAIEIHVQDGQPPREEGREHGLLGWLQSLFGDDGRDHAESYAEAVRRGGHVVSVVTEDTAEAERVGEIMVRNGAVDMDRRTAQWRSEGWTGFQEGSPAYSPEAIERERELRADEKERIPVVEEELEVGKRDVRTGRVRVVSYVAGGIHVRTQEAPHRHPDLPRDPRGRLLLRGQDGLCAAARCRGQVLLSVAAEALRQVAVPGYAGGAVRGQRGAVRGAGGRGRWDWSRRYPVVRLSFGGGVVQSAEALDVRIRDLLRVNAEALGLEQPADLDISGQFAALIRAAHAMLGDRVVVLVDEYDKPILDNLTRPEAAREIRDGLRNLYSVIKDSDAHIRFAF
jgi:hypothetical protein